MHSFQAESWSNAPMLLHLVKPEEVSLLKKSVTKSQSTTAAQIYVLNWEVHDFIYIKLPYTITGRSQASPEI